MNMKIMWINARIITSILHYFVITGLLMNHAVAQNLLDDDYPREAYFNGSSSLRLTSTVSVHRHSALGFATCEGGRLFKQTYNNNNVITLDVVPDGLIFTAIIDNDKYEAKLNDKFLNNVWHNIRLSFRLGNLTLTAGGHSQIIANATYNSAILTLPDINMSNNTLTIGEGFKGCILQGPGILFNNSSNFGALLGQCPLNNQKCPPCLNNPCKNGGTCLEDESGEPKCLCQPKFIGYLCETSKVLTHPICTNNPCQNNGKCHELAENDYRCECLPSWSGKHCETSTLKCASNPCKNGHCKSSLYNYTCECKTGYEGRNCDINIDECITNPCLNKGTCYDNYGSYFCHCSVGFDGQNCENLLNECLSTPCKNGGTCVDELGEYHCICPNEFIGKHCEMKKNCETVNCPDNSICIDNIPRETQCICARGYTGIPPNCTKSYCANNPCSNGGTCNNLNDGYNCTCPPEWKGSRCHIPQSEWCSVCYNGGTCVETIYGVSCHCSRYWTGSQCQEPVTCQHHPCRHASSCHDYHGGYYCSCEPGWTGPECSIDVDECSSNPCINEAVCIDRTNSYYCQCLPGFTGKNCQVNVDECLSQPCLNGGTCIDEINGYSCNCSHNYTGEKCEKEYDACTINPCQNNGTCELITSRSKHDFICNCKPGFEGKICDSHVDDCLRITCQENRICVDGIDGLGCKCKEGYKEPNCTLITDHCSKNPCKNGTCIDLGDKGFHCSCYPGFTGINCDTDINECNEYGNATCNAGICVNTFGSYECFCRPGFSGNHCDVDINECLCGPCKNNATCIDKINSFICNCPAGYQGTTCESQVNECESNPCQNNAECIDHIAAYSCVCKPGFTGYNCEININDCESQPCLNFGKCIDGINSYSCNCTDTGFIGNNCQQNINECLSNPCQNNATCIDAVKSYNCICYSGYTGDNCEVDVPECESAPCQHNGTCLERSHIKNYQQQQQSGLNLPAIFSEEFSYTNASGYECLCIDGLTGKNCEKNIDECESSPCLNGECKDKIGGYICQCYNGFDGDHCENDIDECLHYHPCQHGVCADGKADYTCYCETNYGGKNCSVELIGCNDIPCQNQGTCYPYLVNETQHKFNCSCPNGFYGDICEYETTLSFRKNSRVFVNTSRDEGYDIQFKFRTTLANGALAVGSGSTFYIVKLVDGKLNLYSSILSKWEGVFIGSGLNNSKWQKVFVSINATHLVLSANDEQTIYPINYNEGSNTSPTFPVTEIGVINRLLPIVTTPPYFIGCIQDIVINGESIYAGMTSNIVEMINIESSCPREEQCSPNPCQAGGQCTDNWREFSCKCERPYLGHTCQYYMTAATFSYENITDSFVTVKVSDANRRAVRTIINISMFIRTREPNGEIFYLGSEDDPIYFYNSTSSNKLFDNTFIAAQLTNGELLVKIQFNGTEGYTVGGVKLNDGNNHLIQLIRNATLVQVKINGTEYFKKTISATGQLNVTVLYIGGLPSPPTLTSTSTTSVAAVSVPHHEDDHDEDSNINNNNFVEESPNPRINFKGVIQDVKITNGVKTMVVEFFPLKAEDIPVLFPFGNVSFDHSKILPGVLSDNVCRIEPCHHNGTCHVTWNDFWCQCPRGYTGKTCQEMEFCQLQDCPNGSKCLNLDSGYECVANATFDGFSTALTYIYKTKNHSPANDVYNGDAADSIVEINYRSNTGGILMHIESTNEEHNFFTVTVFKDNVTVIWKLSSYDQGRIAFGKEYPDGNWTKVVIKLNNNFITCGHEYMFDEITALSSSKFNLKSWRELLTTGTVTLGSNNLLRKDSYSSNQTRMLTKGYRYLQDSNSVNWRLTTASPEEISQLEDFESSGMFKGCLGEVRIGSMLLHFFPFNQVYQNSNFTPTEYMDLQPNSLAYSLSKSNELMGCQLCFNSDCKNAGSCKDPFDSYTCECPPGYTLDDCSENIDECKNHTCQNNATCIDGIANYTCKCTPGWESRFCQKDINECMLSNVCKNNGICDNLIGSFKCICPKKYTGKLCEEIITCKNNPCKNNATCYDIADSNKNFNCSCPPGFIGDFCDDIYCQIEKCQNGGFCLTNDEPTCSCRSGFTGPYCEINIDDCITVDSQGRNSTPCANGGICIDGNDSYTCSCTGTGYTGSNCTVDIDECQLNTTFCGHGVCVNLNGSYECQCDEGFCGSDCSFEDPCMKPGVCENQGTCKCDDQNGYVCFCTPEFKGQNCSEKAGTQFFGSEARNIIAYVIGPIVGVLLSIALISLLVLFMMARKKRATRGTYSPSAQEFSNPRVEMDNVMKPPPEERLI